MSAFSQLKDNYVECRTLLHAWRKTEKGAGIIVRAAFSGSKSVYQINFECQRCKMLRLEGWSKVTGDLLWRSYRPPEGYSLPKGAGATRKKMRREYITRQTNTVTWEAPTPRKRAS